MLSNLRNTVLTVLVLALLLAVGLQLFIVERVFLLRDVQSENLDIYAKTRQIEDVLSHGVTSLTIGELPGDRWLENLQSFSGQLPCCEEGAAAIVEALSIPNPSKRATLGAIEEYKSALSAYLGERESAVRVTREQNQLLPWLAGFVILLILLGVWILMRQTILLPVEALLGVVRSAQRGDEVKFTTSRIIPAELVELGSSFESVFVQLRDQIAGRDYELRLARETARSEAEKMSLELAELVDGSSSAIFALGTDGRIKTWNRKIAALTGVPTQVATGSPFEMRFLSGTYRLDFHEAFQKSLAGKPVESMKIPILSETLVVVELLLSISPQKNRDGEIIGVTGFGHPVGDFLEQTAREVEQQRIAHFNELATGAAHQFNQPLQNMRLYLANALNRLRMEDIDRVTLAKKLRGVDEQLTRMSDIVDHLRDFGRSSPPIPGGFDPLTVIERCVELNRGVFAERGIRLTLNSDVDKARVNGHPLQIEKALIAVLDNAREALADEAPEQPVVSVSVHKNDSKEFYILVTDNGGGIDSTILPRIFDPFFTTRLNTRNVGLGLSSARAAIEGIDGQITMASGKGSTTVRISVPLIIGEQHGG